MSKSYEVSIFHVKDADPWCKYLTDLFKKNKEIRVKSLDLDETEYENPPEVAMAIKESYLVVLLASPDMLPYIKDKAWLSKSLSQVPDRTTVVVALCFVDSTEFQESVGDSCKASSSWKHYLMSHDQKENINNVADMLDIVDKNEALAPPSLNRAAKPRSRRKDSAQLRVIPTRVHAPHCDVVIAFKDEVKGTIQVSLTGGQRSSSDPKETPTKHDTKKLNPYTHKFKAPEKAPGTYVLHVYNDAKEIYKAPFYYVSPHEASFTSVEYLCQSLQCENTAALDRKLVDILERSLPEDDSLSSLFCKLRGNLTSGVTKSKSEYPTLLHFAAASGLSDFCSILLDVPGSQIAFQIENCDGKDPADLADVYNHPELAQYIRDFMATSYLADACDLYMAMAGGYRNVDRPETKTESFYMTMGAGGKPVTVVEEDSESDYSKAITDVPPPVQPRASKLPPVPKKALTRQSADASVPPSYRAPPPPAESLSRVQSERRLPPPHPVVEKKSQTLPAMISPSKLMGMMESEFELPNTAMGSSSQNELLDIMKGVKEGNFNPNEALMLFKAWQERNGDGQTKSFKDRQKTLKKMRDDYSAMINTVETEAGQMAKNKQSFFSRLISKKKKPTQRVPHISNPIVHRNTPRSRQVSPHTQDDPRFSNISTASSSSSSSRESSSSMSNDPYCSSDDSERQSRKLDFLEEVDDMEEEQPPLPPRTYTRSDMPRPPPRSRPPMPHPRT